MTGRPYFTHTALSKRGNDLVVAKLRTRSHISYLSKRVKSWGQLATTRLVNPVHGDLKRPCLRGLRENPLFRFDGLNEAAGAAAAIAC